MESVLVYLENSYDMVFDVDHSSAVLNILDATPQLSIGDGEGIEGGDVVFPIQLSRPAHVDVAVYYHLPSGYHEVSGQSNRDPNDFTAVLNEDYAAADYVIIPAGQQTAELRVRALSDFVIEPEEWFVVQPQTESPWINLDAVMQTVVWGAVQDDTVMISLSGAEADEGDELVFNATLSRVADDWVYLEVTPEFHPSLPSATPNADYDAPASYQIAIRPGDTTGELRIPTYADAEIEEDEAIRLQVISCTGAAWDPSLVDGEGVPTVEGTIHDVMPIYVSIGDAQGAEGEDIELPVTLSHASATPIVVFFNAEFNETGSPAEPGSDYGFTELFITFQPGDTEEFITLHAETDWLVEDPEYVTVLISASGNAAIDDGWGLATIWDVPPPLLSIGDAEVTEGGILAFPVTVSTDDHDGITAEFMLSLPEFDYADVGTDFAEGPYTVEFPAGEATATLYVATFDDPWQEGDERFQLQFWNGTGAIVDPDAQVAEATILDAPPIYVSLAPASATEGGELQFRVSLSRPAPLPFTLTYIVSDIEAIEDVDYETLWLYASFDEGEWEKDLIVHAAQDFLLEGQERFTVQWSVDDNPTWAEYDATVEGTIEDAPPPLLAVSDVSFEEGTEGEFTITLSRQASETVSVEVFTVGVTADGDDYQELTSQIVTFEPDELSKPVRIAANFDLLGEATEEFQLFLANPTFAALDPDHAFAVGSIRDRLIASVSPATGFEGDDIEFTVTLSRPASEELTVTYAITADTASAGDYTVVTAEAHFEEGNDTAYVTVHANGDLILEENELLEVSFVGGAGVSAHPDFASAVGTIQNRLPAPVWSVTVSDVTEGGYVYVTVSRAHNTVGDAEIQITFDPIGIDGPAGVGTITQLPSGVGSATPMYLIPDDFDIESLKHYTVHAFGEIDGVAFDAGTAEFNVLDNDAVFSIDPAEIREAGGVLTAKIHRSGDISRPLTVHYATQDGTAGSDDYTATEGQLEFAADVESRSVEITITDDAIPEVNEEFSLVLSIAGFGTWASGTLKILNDDVAVPLVTSIRDFGLVVDTGASDEDLVTTDPRLKGRIASDGYFSQATVQFDHHGDGKADGSVTLYVDGDTFEYDPRVTEPALNQFAGSLRLRYRTVEYVGAVRPRYGEWISYPITLQLPDAAPLIQVFDATGAPLADGGVVSFGVVPAGASNTKTFKIVNYGEGALNLEPPTLPDGYSLTSTWPTVVPADGGEATFQIMLESNDPAAYSGEFSFETDDPRRPTFHLDFAAAVVPSSAEIEVRASGAELQTGTGTIDFGTTLTSMPIDRRIEISNRGSQDLKLDATRLRLPPGYTVTEWFSATVAPGATTHLTIRLQSTLPGRHDGSFALYSNDFDERPFRIRLQGGIVAPTPSIEIRRGSEQGRVLRNGMDFLDFGVIEPGQSVSKTIDIANRGDAPLSLSNLTLPAGFTATALPSTPLAPGGSIAVTVLFQPADEGTYWGDFVFVNNDPLQTSFRIALVGDACENISATDPSVALSLKTITGAFAGERSTADPRVVAAASLLPAGETARVEFDHDGNDSPDGSMSVEGSSTALYDPRIQGGNQFRTPGAKLLRSRLVRLDEFENVVWTGPWRSFVFTLERSDLRPVSKLVEDDGARSDDFVTSDPRVSVTVPTGFGTARGNTTVRVEFEHDDGTNTFGTSVALSAPGQTAVYDPRLADALYDSTLGPKTIRYRAVLVDSQGADIVAEDWRVLSFTLIEAPGELRISEFGLTLDSGSSASDLVTSSPIVYFRLAGSIDADETTAVDFLHVNLADPGDEPTPPASSAAANATVQIPDLDEEYVYDPREAAANAMTQHGTKVLYYRVRRTPSVGDEIVETWQPFRFVWESPPASNAALSTPGLASDTGGSNSDRITSDPRITGTIGGGESVDQPYRIEADWNGDGTFDTSAFTVKEQTSWKYVVSPPPSYAYGINRTVVLRGREWSPSFGDYLYTPPATFTFSFQPDPGPPLAELKLSEDTGTSATDGLTSNPALHGKVAGDAPGVTAIQAETIGMAGSAITVYSNEYGEFNLLPRVQAIGTPTLVAVKAGRYDSRLNAVQYGTPTTATFTFTPSIPQIDTFEIAEDTGGTEEEREDGITRNPLVRGTLTTSSAPSAGVTIAINEDDDADIEGWTTTLGNGEFTYRPTILQANMRLTAYTSKWNDHLQAHLVGASKTLTFEFETVPFQASTLTLDAAKRLSTSGVITTRDPAITGNLSGGTTSTGIVEFELTGDETPDDQTSTEADGSFTYVPLGFTVGPHQLRARVRQWDANARQEAVGEWMSFSYEILATAHAAATIADFHLATDTGSSPNDGVTGNPVFSGTITRDGDVAGVPVEFDLNGDGVGDALAFSDATGSFTYRAVGIPFTPEGSTSIVRARSVQWNTASGEYEYDAQWGTSVAFVHAFDPPQPASMRSFTTKAVPSSGNVSDSTLIGYVANDNDLANVMIELDYGNNGSIDNRVLTDQFGSFQIKPDGVVPGVPFTVVAYVRDRDASTGVVTVDAGTTCTFTYVPPVNAAPTVASFGLSNDTDVHSAVTSDPTVKGSVQNDNGFGAVTLEVEETGDQTPDYYIGLAADGTFEFRPRFTSSGPHTVTVRAREALENGSYLYSEPNGVSFDYRPRASAWARIASLALEDDTGNSDTDSATADPTILGVVSGVGAPTKVELDVSGDGIPDVYVTTNSQGEFSYTPDAALIEYGYVTITASLEPYSATIGSKLKSSITFLYHAEPDGAEAQAMRRSFTSLQSQWNRAGSDYTAALEKAAELYAVDRSEVGAKFDLSSENAARLRDAALFGARRSYDAAVSQADAAYATALGAVQSQFVTALGSYAGDASPFENPNFAWPTTPDVARYQPPADSDQPTPPAAPRDDQTPYDWERDNTYQNAIAGADNAFREAERQAQSLYKTAERNLSIAYEGEAGAASEQYLKDARKADDDYAEDLTEGVNPYDLQVESRKYEAAKGRIDGRYYREKYEVEQRIAKARAALNNWRDSQSIPIADPQAAAQRARENAWTYATRSAAINDDETKSLQDLKQTLANDRAELDRLWTRMQRDSEHWEAERRLNAENVRQKALNAAVKKRDHRIAEAAYTRDEQLAEKIRIRDLAIETARIDAVKNRSDARVTAVTAWDNATDSRWTEYYRTIVANDAAYVASLKPKAEGRVTEELGAEKTERVNNAGFRRTFDKETAGLKQTRDNDDADSFKTKASFENAAVRDRARDDADSWKKYQVAWAKAEREWVVTASKSAHNFADMQATLDYAYFFNFGPGTESDGNAEWRIDQAVGYNEVGAEYRGVTSPGFFDVELELATRDNDNQLERAKANSKAWYEYQAATFKHDQTRREDFADRAETYVKAKADHAATFTVQFAGKYVTYVDAVSGAAKVTMNFAATQAKLFEVDVNVAEATRDKNDTTASVTYRNDVAQDYLTKITAWDGSLQSTWSTFQKSVASHLKDAVSSLGGDVTGYVDTLSGHFQTSADQYAGYAKTLLDAIAKADDDETKSENVGIKDYAEDVAEARQTFAYSTALAEKDFAKEVAEQDASLKTAVAKVEQAYIDRRAEMEFDLTTPNRYLSAMIGPDSVNYNFWAGPIHRLENRDQPPSNYNVAYSNYRFYLSVPQQNELLFISEGYDSQGNPSPTPFGLASRNLHRYGSYLDFELLKTIEQRSAEYARETIGRSEYFALLKADADAYYSVLANNDVADYQDRIALRTERLLGTAAANGVDGLLTSHKQWMAGVHGANVKRAEDFQSASVILAASLKTATDTFAGAGADAAKAFSNALSGAAKDYDDDAAEDDKTLSGQAVTVGNSLNSNVTGHYNTLREDVVGDRGDYETALHQSNYDRLENASVPSSGALAQLRSLQQGIAAADLNQAESLRDARNDLEDDRSAERTALLDGGLTVDGATPLGEKQAQVNRTTGISHALYTLVTTTGGAADTLNQSSATALRNTLVDIRKAESTNASAHLVAEFSYDVDKAKADKKFDIDVENAVIDWTTKAMQAEKALADVIEAGAERQYVLPRDLAEYELWQRNAARRDTRDAAIDALEAPYKSWIKNSRVQFAQDAGDAQATWGSTVTTADVTAEGVIGTAVSAGQTNLNTAENTYLAAVNPADKTFAQNAGQAGKTYTDNSARLAQGLVALAGTHTVAYAQSVADARATSAKESDLARTDFVIATLGGDVARSDQSFTICPVLPAARYEAVEQANALTHLQLDRLTNLRTAHADYVHDLTSAREQEQVDVLQAAADRDDDAASADADLIEDRSERDYDAFKTETEKAGDFDEDLTDRTHTLTAALPGYDQSLLVNFAKSDRAQLARRIGVETTYQKAAAALESGESLADSIEKSHTVGLAQGELDWRRAVSAADLLWTDSVSQAEKTFREDVADDVYDYAEGVADRKRDREQLDATDVETHDLALLDADDDQRTAVQTAANTRRSAEYLAEATWRDADHSDRVTRLDAVALSLNIPAANAAADLADAISTWWTTTGRVAYLAHATALNDSDSTFITDLNTSINDARSTEVENDRLAAEDEADDAYDRRAAELSAELASTKGSAAADRTFQLDMARRRQAESVGNARIALTKANGDQDLADEQWADLQVDLASREAAAEDRYAVGVNLAEGNAAIDRANAAADCLALSMARRLDRGTTKLSSEQSLADAVAEAERAQAAAIASAERTFTVTQAQSLASAVHTFAQANPSPWSARADGVYAAEATRAAAIADAQENLSVTSAQADENYQSALAAAAHDKALTEFSYELDHGSVVSEIEIAHGRITGEATKTWSSQTSGGLPTFAPGAAFDLEQYYAGTSQAEPSGNSGQGSYEGKAKNQPAGTTDPPVASKPAVAILTGLHPSGDAVLASDFKPPQAPSASKVKNGLLGGSDAPVTFVEYLRNNRAAAFEAKLNSDREKAKVDRTSSTYFGFLLDDRKGLEVDGIPRPRLDQLERQGYRYLPHAPVDGQFAASLTALGITGDDWVCEVEKVKVFGEYYAVLKYTNKTSGETWYAVPEFEMKYRNGYRAGDRTVENVAGAFGLGFIWEDPQGWKLIGVSFYENRDDVVDRLTAHDKLKALGTLANAYGSVRTLHAAWAEKAASLSNVGRTSATAFARQSAPGTGFGSLSQAGKYGIRSYNDLRKLTAGTELQAHHLFEKRFAGVLGASPGKMSSIAVTQVEHQIFTNAWRQLTPYGQGTANATREQIMNAARIIYKDYPDILNALGL